MDFQDNSETLNWGLVSFQRAFIIILCNLEE